MIIKKDNPNKIKRLGVVGGNRKPQSFKYCETCGILFGPIQNLSIRFCSRVCMYKLRKTGGRKGRHYPNEQRAVKRNCLVCKLEFRAVKDSKNRKQIYCSLPCAWKEWRAKVTPSNFRQAENNHAWKGDEVGYDGVHKWVAKQLGKPSVCEHCGRTDQKRYEWANIDHSYFRDTKDYMRLCVSCHRKWDIQFNQLHVFGK